MLPFFLRPLALVRYNFKFASALSAIPLLRKLLLGAIPPPRHRLSRDQSLTKKGRSESERPDPYQNVTDPKHCRKDQIAQVDSYVRKLVSLGLSDLKPCHYRNEAFLNIDILIQFFLSG
jgi:hypothetical protein